MGVCDGDVSSNIIYLGRVLSLKARHHKTAIARGTLSALRGNKLIAAA